MRILVVSLLANKMVLKVSDAVPQIGCKVDMFYFPPPIVKEVLYYPDEKTLQDTGFSDIDVMVYVE